MGAITMAEVGIDTRRYFHPQQETMPRERLAALQLARLNATLANAYANVPLVRRQLLKAGVRLAGRLNAIFAGEPAPSPPPTIPTDPRQWCLP